MAGRIVRSSLARSADCRSSSDRPQGVPELVVDDSESVEHHVGKGLGTLHGPSLDLLEGELARASPVPAHQANRRWAKSAPPRRKRSRGIDGDTRRRPHAARSRREVEVGGSAPFARATTTGENPPRPDPHELADLEEEGAGSGHVVAGTIGRTCGQPGLVAQKALEARASSSASYFSSNQALAVRMRWKTSRAKIFGHSLVEGRARGGKDREKHAQARMPPSRGGYQVEELTKGASHAPRARSKRGRDQTADDPLRQSKKSTAGGEVSLHETLCGTMGNGAFFFFIAPPRRHRPGDRY